MMMLGYVYDDVGIRIIFQLILLYSATLILAIEEIRYLLYQ